MTVIFTHTYTSINETYRAERAALSSGEARALEKDESLLAFSLPPYEPYCSSGSYATSVGCSTGGVRAALQGISCLLSRQKEPSYRLAGTGPLGSGGDKLGEFVLEMTKSQRGAG